MFTTEQIEYLFTFCKKHFVQYYDVQVELVDHLANAIEVEMKNDPSLTFEKAVEKVHAGFGVMGFAPLVSEKQKAAEKHSQRLFIKLFKQQFKWPQIFLFLLLTSIFYTLFSFKSIHPAFIFGSAVSLSYFIFFLNLFQLQSIAKKTHKKFLIINLSWAGLIFFIPLNGYNMYQFFFEGRLFNFTDEHFIAIYASIFLSLYLIASMVFRQTFIAIKNKLHEDYPEVFSLSK